MKVSVWWLLVVPVPESAIVTYGLLLVVFEASVSNLSVALSFCCAPGLYVAWICTLPCGAMENGVGGAVM